MKDEGGKTRRRPDSDLVIYPNPRSRPLPASRGAIYRFG